MEHINSRKQKKNADSYNEFALTCAIYIIAGLLWGWNEIIAEKVLWKYASAVKM